MDDSDLSLQEYWVNNWPDIARWRKWKNPKGTRDGYNYRMKLMAEAAPEIVSHKPIKELVMIEVIQVMERVQANRTGSVPLGESTINGCGSLIRDILGHAELCGLPIRNLNRYENTILKRTVSELCSTVVSPITARMKHSSSEKLLERLEDEVALKKNTRKSLTMQEMRFIMKYIADHLVEDGRYIGLAIMMYSGLHPGEVRALQWEDIHSIIGPPGCSYFEIHHTLDRQGNEVDRPKTSNGFRNVPVHCELSQLLSRWRKHIMQESCLPMTGGINGMPPKQVRPRGYICCKENDFGKPCSYQAFADFAKKKVFRQLDQEMCDAADLEFLLVKNSQSPDYDPDDDLTTYVLRRNFWTWIQYGTPCTRLEKLYVMGHKMEEDGHDKRRRYSTPKALQDMAMKMNTFSILQEMHPHAVALTSLDSTEYRSECGFLEIEIPAMKPGQTRTIMMLINSIERNDCLELRLCSLFPEAQTVNISYSVTSMQPPSERRHALITESSTLEAIENSKKASAAESDS